MQSSSDSGGHHVKRQDKRSSTPPSGSQRIYQFEVSIIGGPVTEGFAEKNPVVLRTIQILSLIHI